MGNSQATQKSSSSQSWKELEGNNGYGSVEYAALEELLQSVRSDRVRAEFYKLPESQYTDINEVRIWASTYNLNGRKPPENLNMNEYVRQWQSRWPKRNTSDVEKSPDRADIYLMGFQEAVPLNAQNIIAGWTAAPVGWDLAIDRSLNPWKNDKEFVRSSSLDSATDKSLIDFYESGWSGVPSGNLESRVRASLPEANLRRGSSCDDQRSRTSEGVLSGPGSRSVSLDVDLISFESSDKNKGHQTPPPGAVLKRIGQIDDTGEPVKQLNQNKEPERLHEEFIQLFRYQLVGLYVSGWVRKSILKRISGVQITTVATGALGYLANKGAIAVRFRIDDSSVVFVTSHLASGSGEGDQIKRNLDFTEIVRRTQFPCEISLVKVLREDGTEIEDFSARPEGIPDNASYEVKRAFVGGKWGSVRRLRELDNIIWVGDLNYRINAKAANVIPLIRADKLNVLLEVDQLSVERAAGNVFQDFVEAPIDFPPTYKFVRGTGYYTGEIDEESSSDSEDMSGKTPRSLTDLSSSVMSYPVADDLLLSSSDSVQRRMEAKQSIGERHKSAFMTVGPLKPEFSSVEEEALKRTPSAGDIPVLHKKEEKVKKKAKKIRTPAWTDRILWYSSKKRLHQLLYGCFSELSVSDHKPVIATFLMEVRKFDLRKVDSCLQEARRHIDVEEMASIPKCKLSPTTIDVGNVRYGQPIEYSVTLHNIGEVAAAYSFIPPNLGVPVPRSPFPKWLSAQPTSGVIRSGKKEHVQIRVCIEGGQWGSADELYDEHENRLDHILVLHLEGGSDFFISITGSFTLSTFGLSLNNLATRLPNDLEKVTGAIATNSVKLPSLRYREKREYATGWELPTKEDASTDLDQHSVARPLSTHSTRLHKSTSLAATGVQPNLLEGPTGLMIPTEVSRMLYFLAEADRLRTPHIFVESMKQISKAKENTSSLPSIVAIRDALDNASSFPTTTTAHDMATTLFTFFMDLPSPLIPESVAQNCEMSDISAVMAMSLVKEAMSAIEWSVFDSTLEVMRSALMEENVVKNQLTEEGVAKVLAQIFFQDIFKSQCCTKPPLQGMDASCGTQSRKVIVENRRCMFIRQFLKLDKPLIDLDEVTPSEISYKSS